VKQLTLFVLAHFKDNALEPLTDPADRAMLFRQIRTIVLVVGMGEEFQNFLEPNSTLRVAPQPLTFAPIEVKPHPQSITVIPEVSWTVRSAGRFVVRDLWSENAGINRHIVGDERALRKRRSDFNSGLESCLWLREKSWRFVARRDWYFGKGRLR
jgi:hypothetical protein